VGANGLRPRRFITLLKYVAFVNLMPGPFKTSLQIPLPRWRIKATKWILMNTCFSATHSAFTLPHPVATRSVHHYQTPLARVMAVCKLRHACRITFFGMKRYVLILPLLSVNYTSPCPLLKERVIQIVQMRACFIKCFFFYFLIGLWFYKHKNRVALRSLYA
jgi:hypothetical protein